MPVEAPETQARAALIAGLTTIFGTEADVRNSRIHGMLGMDGTIIGVYPARTRPWSRDVNVQDMEIVVQFYGEYDLQVNPEMSVAPDWIEERAERFRLWVEDNGQAAAGQKWWWFDVREIRFPTDPTGNITRFESIVVARANNSAVIETS